MKKIVIIGALGYLGTELSKIYSGESWKNKIVAIDSRFISERVSQLKDWGIEFIQGHILDKEFLKKNLHDADVVHHLAGVTDVAYVKSEENSELDNRITSVGVKGTNNILNSISKKCKIIFPSTHVVFEGIKKVTKNITENEPTFPLLTYAKSKVQNEIDIKNSNKNYVILRLGSVYGYSLDTMRINIMPNLFSKIASQNGSIKLYAGGKQLKSLVNLIDVVRCMKFMEENFKIKNEIFHLVNEQTTVKQVAEICKKINPNLKLEITDDEIPNEGYTLSNYKLLKTGFKFLYNLEDSIKQMIGQWLFKKNTNNLEHVFKGQNEFVDSRGKISNYELPEPVNLIGYIESKQGSVRANHFHPIQEQKCLLIKGQVISVYKDLLEANSPIVTHVVNEGDLIVTKPNVAHAMIFSKDTIFLNLVRGERKHQNYGITHTLPFKLVDEKIRKNVLKNYKFDCRCCGKKDLKRVVSLGLQPLANNLKTNKNQEIDTYPLEMNYCPNCHNCQLSVAIDSKKMFSNYLYVSSTSKTSRDHFVNSAKKYVKEFNLNPKKSYILDIGSNDGITLKSFKKLNFKKILGIEPAKNLANLANKNKIKTFNGFLTKKNLKKIKKNADLILASNVFAHSDDLNEMAECMISLLSKKGTIIIEVQYLMNTLQDLTFDNIYHEHYNYWSLTSLINFFRQFNVKIFRVEKIKTHGGSLRIYIQKEKNIKVDKSVNEILKEEEIYGIKNYNTYKKFGEKVYKIRDNVIKNINKLKKDGNKLVGYGAPAKATTALNFFGISNEIDCIIEDNKLKQGKIVPGVNIPIISKENIKKKPDNLIVLAWNFFEEIKRENRHLSKQIISIKDLEK
jgi:nucleoside-diphosphate-sugar epimerase/quercetin dioxygenase-like cupin family protein